MKTNMRDKCPFLFMSIVAQQQTDDDTICCLSVCLTVIWSLATFPDWLLNYPLYSYDIRMKSSMMPIFMCSENKANTLLHLQESTSTWRPLVAIAQCVTVLCVLIGLCALSLIIDFCARWSRLVCLLSLIIDLIQATPPSSEPTSTRGVISYSPHSSHCDTTSQLLCRHHRCMEWHHFISLLLVQLLTSIIWSKYEILFSHGNVGTNFWLA